jgi:hypothetical protein
MLLDGRAQAIGIRKSSNDATLLLVIDGHGDLVESTLPGCYGGMQWSLLIDTDITVSSAKDRSILGINCLFAVFEEKVVPPCTEGSSASYLDPLLILVETRGGERCTTFCVPMCPVEEFFVFQTALGPSSKI